MKGKRNKNSHSAGSGYLVYHIELVDKNINSYKYDNQQINDGSSVHHQPLGRGALDVDHDALDEDRDHHELDALALHNPLASPSML